MIDIDGNECLGVDPNAAKKVCVLVFIVESVHDVVTLV